MAEIMRHTNWKLSTYCVALLFTPLVFVGTAFGAAPVVDASGSTISSIENRIKRIESRLDNQGLSELIVRVERLQQEMQRVIGELEVQNHELKTLKEQQRKLYSDIDNRLRRLEQSATQGGAGGAPASGNSSDLVSPPIPGQIPVTPRDGSTASLSTSSPPTPQQNAMTEVERNLARSAYERAFNLLKQGRYDLAIQSFQAFLETYPSAIYADNAQYWLGEANYVKKRYKVALTEFKKVIDNYPSSPKRADALLKMGYTYGELGDKQQAMKTLNMIVSTFPDTTAARLAQKRLQNLKASR